MRNALVTRRAFASLGGAYAIGRLPLRGAPIPADLATPYKAGRLILSPSGKPGAFDEKAVDCPFVFRDRDRYFLLHVGFDGSGYQTGLARSTDLLHWTSEGVVFGRRPENPILRYNAAMTWIVRENDVFSPGRLKKVRGRYLGVYHAYPNRGFEQGAAVIGLCWSKDLRAWEAEPPCLRPEDGADWERGGLYKPCLVEEKGTFYLVYNAKNPGAHWHEQTGVATSRDLKTWTRNPANPIIRNGGPGSVDEKFASDPCVLGYRGQWAIFYYSLDGKGVARDLLALSPDLFRAAKCDGLLIDVGPPGSVDSRYAHKPSVIAKNGVVYHFYCAVSTENVRGISVAASKRI